VPSPWLHAFSAADHDDDGDADMFLPLLEVLPDAWVLEAVE
jgi:hypothetical protein